MMSLLPPPPNIQGRYVRLLAMAERGTKHEAVVAEMKLASLRGRYDFSVSPATAMTDPEDDLFSDAARIRPDQRNTRRLIVFEMVFRNIIFDATAQGLGYALRGPSRVYPGAKLGPHA
jgi:hypothetical protein